jgi:hypothetical protein
MWHWRAGFGQRNQPSRGVDDRRWDAMPTQPRGHRREPPLDPHRGHFGRRRSGVRYLRDSGLGTPVRAAGCHGRVMGTGRSFAKLVIAGSAGVCGGRFEPARGAGLARK